MLFQLPAVANHQVFSQDYQTYVHSGWVSSQKMLEYQMYNHFKIWGFTFPRFEMYICKIKKVSFSLTDRKKWSIYEFMAMFEISSTKSKTMSHKMSIKWESEMGVLYTYY